jgi:hypothetical protein
MALYCPGPASRLLYASPKRLRMPCCTSATARKVASGVLRTSDMFSLFTAHMNGLGMKQSTKPRVHVRTRTLFLDLYVVATGPAVRMCTLLPTTTVLRSIFLIPLLSLL